MALSDYFRPLLEEPANPHAGILLIPGLNLRPESLNEIANQFILRGVRSHIVDLKKPFRGQNISGDKLSALWEAEVRQSYINLRSEFPDRPVLVLGYSLGALLALNLVNEDLQKPASIILLAPPLKLKFLPACMLAALRIMPASYRMASAAPLQYRIESWTSGAEYHALRSLRERVLSRLGKLSQSSLKGVALWPKDDEMIAWQQSLQLIKEIVPSFQRRILHPRGDSPKHLMIDESSLGADSWRELWNVLDASITEATSSQKDILEP